jgi:hypothetical protein
MARTWLGDGAFTMSWIPLLLAAWVLVDVVVVGVFVGFARKRGTAPSTGPQSRRFGSARVRPGGDGPLLP